MQNNAHFLWQPPILSVGNSEANLFVELINYISLVKSAIDNEVGTGLYCETDMKNGLGILNRRKC